MSLNPFEGQHRRLARTLTERFGVDVICRGDNAYTNGKVIVLPSLPEPMSSPLERMVVGFLDHEMGHVAFSDFDEVGWGQSVLPISGPGPRGRLDHAHRDGRSETTPDAVSPYHIEGVGYRSAAWAMPGRPRGTTRCVQLGSA